ncbi:FkbM family methyltransferase [Mycolicibacterium sarraceniae]|uniref:Methyltransferase FkbM domain-containing protein n=1 Tax=Mycolicibacterium sarraceniae TaxID=1534348 RepID=A0A7I7SQS3_9MYCO|nr:FkbM family methyltransferase [Mycolicibacterium sarraceniae]BBY59344.1 hypothetical protein MSAR_24800 [Mycolicibacterium sarraceniae]
MKNIASYLYAYTPQSGDTILEIGAGVGTEVGLLSNAVGKSGRVIAVEADPTAIRRLEKQVAELKHQNVEVVAAAVGAEEGVIQLDIVEPGALMNSTVATVGGASVTVRCKTLPAISRQYKIDTVSYMKLNIEGAEYDALVGLGPSIKNIENMCISCHDFTGIPAQRTYRKTYDYLKEQNFRLTSLPPNPAAPWEDYYIFASRGPA